MDNGLGIRIGLELCVYKGFVSIDGIIVLVSFSFRGREQRPARAGVDFAVDGMFAAKAFLRPVCGGPCFNCHPVPFRMQHATRTHSCSALGQRFQKKTCSLWCLLQTARKTIELKGPENQRFVFVMQTGPIFGFLYFLSFQASWIQKHRKWRDPDFCASLN